MTSCSHRDFTQRIYILQRVIHAVEVGHEGQWLKDITLDGVHRNEPFRCRVIESGFGVVHTQHIVPVVAGIVRLRPDAPVRAGEIALGGQA